MARRDCSEAADVGAVMLAAVRIGLATLRQHLTDPDPKTALRAVAELTKLLGVCARHGIAVEAATEEVAGSEVSPTATPITEAEPTHPSRKRERRNDDVPSLTLPARIAPSLTLPAPNRLPGGKRLTSFLGAAVATGSGGDLAVTSSAGPAAARGGLPSEP